MFFRNPHNFDCPPPNYDKPDDLGWTMLAKAIIANDGGLEKYINYAKRAKQKQDEWENLPFIKPYAPRRSKYKKYKEFMHKTATTVRLNE